MKRTQLSSRKISAVNNMNKSQSKISSFFTKVLKPDADDSKVILDVKSSSQPSNSRKRKEQNDMSDEELYVNVKKMQNTNSYDTVLEHNVAKSINNKSSENSVPYTRSLEDIYKAFKDNKAMCKTPEAQKVNKKDTNAVLTGRMKHNVTLLETSTTVETTDVSKTTNGHILKKSQNLDSVLKPFSPEEAYDRNIKINKLHDSKKESHEDFSIIDEDEFDDFFDQEWCIDGVTCKNDIQINFTTLQRCKILEVKHELKITTLKVQQVESESIDTVVCSGFWRDVQVKIHDIVTIQAKKEMQQWIIDNNNGFIVIQPDILISGTTITSGLFCNRRAILTDKFRKIESLPNLNADYSVMTIGSLVHQWLQRALRENMRALSDVIKLLDNILQSKETMEYLYASELSFTDCRKKMMEYAPKIYEFIQHYIKGNKQQHLNNLKDNFQGSIYEIQDIEENIWIPQLGMKGRIDVTAKVNIHSRKKIMPLEVKTGRVSYSPEHKGQVILYLMMMNFIDKDIDTGLLLYLKNNSIQEIKTSHHEKRDLLLLRNTLAHYLAKKSKDSWDMTSVSDLKLIELPEPINHHSACIKCPYQTLCCMYLARDPDIKLLSSHPLTALINELLNDFESSHLDYIVKWIALLQLEENSEDNNTLSNVWTMTPEKRELQGTCICNLKIVGKVEERDNFYKHTFKRVNIKEQNVENSMLGTTLAENDYVFISTDARINVSTGYITHVSNDTVVVLLDKDMQQNAQLTFHIDKYTSANLYTFNYANIGGLLSNDEIYIKLRRIIIDKQPATFMKRLPRSIVSASTEIIYELNEDQQRAVLKAIAANEYLLVKGMPGTGKTQMLVALIELLQKLGSTVLITAHTHSAVDNVLLKLLDKNIDFLRLGSTKQIHPLLTCKSEEYMTKSCDVSESLEALYNSKKIVAVTCYGAYHALIRRRMFDVCVVDESAQIMQPTILRPLYSARKFILVGDPDQLPPVIKSKTASKLGADESLFVRLNSDNNTINLTKQYRMNSRIMKLANDLTYHGKLEPGNKQIENATLTGSNMEILSSCEKWICNALSKNLDDSVIVLNTGNIYNLNIGSYNKDLVSTQTYSNIWEAAIISRLIQALTEAGINARNIGIIAPYNAHITLLKKIVDKEVEVNTVDRYQGRDKDVILYSCTRSIECDKKKQFEILDDQRRLTVAITRAKHKLIIVGDKDTLMRYTPFKNLFEVIEEKNIINLHDGEEDFRWKNLIRSIL